MDSLRLVVALISDLMAATTEPDCFSPMGWSRRLGLMRTRTSSRRMRRAGRLSAMRVLLGAFVLHATLAPLIAWPVLAGEIEGLRCAHDS